MTITRDDLTPLLQRAQNTLGPEGLRTVYDLWGQAFLTWIDMNFRREGSPAWAPIKRPGQIGRDTGHLAQSFTYRLEPDGITGGTNVDYAPYFHEGTSPHEIVAHGKALRFMWFSGPGIGALQRRGRYAGAELSFFKRVQHPGTVARPLLPTEEQVMTEMRLGEITQAYLTRMLEAA